MMPPDVSIHAPAWGATRNMEFLSCPSLEFQSTHPRGVRLRLERVQQIVGRSFNPRTRVGCDYTVGAYVKNSTKFQSTHPRGVRHGRLRQHREVTMFQSTHPRGVRPDQLVSVSILGGFNPRTRVGCDASKCLRMSAGLGFQSTHPRGVRRSWTGPTRR